MAICIYALTCPFTGMPRYIGKANDANKRLHTHIRDSRRRHGPVQKWIRDLLAVGLKPGIYIVADNLSQDSWKSVEKTTIKAARDMLGRDYILNLANGGDQPPNTKTAEQLSQTAKKVVAARTKSAELAQFYKLKHNIGQMLHRGLLTRSAKDKLLISVTKHPELFPETWQTLLRQ